MTVSSHRKRMRRIDNNDARYITFSCYRRLPLFQNDLIKDAFADALGAARTRHGFRLYAWVVMPEHVHLLLWPGPPVNRVPIPLAPILHDLKSTFAQRTLRRWRELRAPILSRLTAPDGSTRFWQRDGGYDRNTFSWDELDEKARYIHNNPVRRGLVIAPTDYPWSSARWYAGDRAGPVPINLL